MAAGDLKYCLFLLRPIKIDYCSPISLPIRKTHPLILPESVPAFNVLNGTLSVVMEGLRLCRFLDETRETCVESGA